MPCSCSCNDGGARNGLVVTEVEVELWDAPNRGKHRAFAGLVLNGSIAIKSIRVIELDDGRLVVAMPNREQLSGNRVDVIHPIDRETRLWLDGHVLEAYLDALAERRASEQREALLAEAC